MHMHRCNAAAVLIALTGYGCLVRATAETWWVKSGFERNPGYFISALNCSMRSMTSSAAANPLHP
jgi:hypothetical protein